MTSQASPAVLADLAPTGKLRAAINLGNPILASKDSVTGALRGVSVDLSHELARRLGVPLELASFPAAGKVIEGLGAWDVAYLSIDPARAVDLDRLEAARDRRRYRRTLRRAPSRLRSSSSFPVNERRGCRCAGRLPGQRGIRVGHDFVERMPMDAT